MTATFSEMISASMSKLIIDPSIKEDVISGLLIVYNQATSELGESDRALTVFDCLDGSPPTRKMIKRYLAILLEIMAKDNISTIAGCIQWIKLTELNLATKKDKGIPESRLVRQIDNSRDVFTSVTFADTDAEKALISQLLFNRKYGDFIAVCVKLATATTNAELIHGFRCFNAEFCMLI